MRIGEWMVHREMRSCQQGEMLSAASTFYMISFLMITVLRKGTEITLTLPLSESPCSMGNLTTAKAQLPSVIPKLRETFTQDSEKPGKWMFPKVESLALISVFEGSRLVV